MAPNQVDLSTLNIYDEEREVNRMFEAMQNLEFKAREMFKEIMNARRVAWRIQSVEEYNLLSNEARAYLQAMKEYRDRGFVFWDRLQTLWMYMDAEADIRQDAERSYAKVMAELGLKIESRIREEY